MHRLDACTDQRGSLGQAVVPFGCRYRSASRSPWTRDRSSGSNGDEPLLITGKVPYLLGKVTPWAPCLIARAPGRRGGLRERKKLAVRHALGSTALRLAVERDRRTSVTVEDITAEADVSLRTFGNYFSSKYEAIGPLLRRALEQLATACSQPPAGQWTRNSSGTGRTTRLRPNGWAIAALSMTGSGACRGHLAVWAAA